MIISDDGRRAHPRFSGGRVRDDAGVAISVRTREAGIVKGGSRLRIEVTDSGIGIETERLE